MPYETQNPPPPPPARRRHRRWPWVLLALVILLPLLALGWTGLYHIPVVSDLFGTSKPIDLGIHPTAADLESALRDNPMQLKGEPSTYYGMAKKRFTGSTPVDDVHSSEELTAFIARYNQGARYVRDIQVKVIDGGVELSGFVVPKINAPAYAKVGIARTSEKTVAITVDKAKIGRLTIPSSYYDDIAEAATDWINDRLADVDGFRMDTLEYSDGTAHLAGTLPATVEIIPGEEYTILGQRLRDL